MREVAIIGAGELGGAAAHVMARRDVARSIVLVDESGTVDLKIDRRRLFGSAPEALASGARALVALALNGSPRDVALSVLGVPPSQTVIPWEDATASGF